MWPDASEREQVRKGCQKGLLFSWVFQSIARLWKRVFSGVYWRSDSAPSRGLTHSPHVCSPICLLCHEDATCHTRRLHCSVVAFDNRHLCHYWAWAAYFLCPAPVSWAASLTDLLDKLQLVSVTLMALYDLRGEAVLGKVSHVRQLFWFFASSSRSKAAQHTYGEAF